MDTPGFDPASVTGIVAGGANLVAFTTGRGSCFGFKPTPSLKIASNSSLFNRMPEDMDFNAGTIVEGRSVAEVGRELFLKLLDVASGEKTCSENLGIGDEEFVPWLVGPVFIKPIRSTSILTLWCAVSYKVDVFTFDAEPSAKPPKRQGSSIRQRHRNMHPSYSEAFYTACLIPIHLHSTCVTTLGLTTRSSTQDDAIKPRIERLASSHIKSATVVPSDLTTGG